MLQWVRGVRETGLVRRMDFNSLRGRICCGMVAGSSGIVGGSRELMRETTGFMNWTRHLGWADQRLIIGFTARCLSFIATVRTSSSKSVSPSALGPPAHGERSHRRWCAANQRPVLRIG